MASAFDKKTNFAIATLAIVAAVAWFTMEKSNLRTVTLVLLGFFAFRIVMVSVRRAAEESSSRE